MKSPPRPFRASDDSSSENRQQDESTRALRELTAEARDHLGPPDLDWAKLEASLMKRVEAEKPALLRDAERAAARPLRANLLRAGTAALAIAAAIAFVVKERDTRESSERPTAVATDLPAGALLGSEGAGEVRIGGAKATPGHVLRAGDLIEADGARALFDRASAKAAHERAVSWMLEPSDGIEASPDSAERLEKEPRRAKAKIKAAGEALVVALDDGAVEAQVTPVPSGEAFAVDVAAGANVVRVAVHGTHLRVARTDNRVSVDLTEGVVSIGVPPRAGSTYGTLVTAPAHVEFDPSNLTGTLHIEHEPKAVRPAIALSPHEAATQRTERSDPTSPSLARVESEPSTPPLSHPVTSSPAAPLIPKFDPKVLSTPPARTTILSAVKKCGAAKHGASDVRVTVSSTLTLTVAQGGVVQFARFDPPLLPEVQTCAAAAIYKTKLDETGTVIIPIEIAY